MKRTLVKNSWYVAAFSDEVGHKEPLGRVIVGEPLVLYRRRTGEAVALEDRCPHRRMPLSAGRLTADDKLVCGYHGLTFDSCGKCVLVPGQASPPPLRIRSYPVHEKSGVVWVWMGVGDAPEPVAPYDTSWLERPGWRTTKLYRHAKANYLLLHDNLADLLHVAYLHIPSGGGNEQMGAADLEFKPLASGYDLRRVTRDIPAPVSYGRLANPRGRVDRWHVAEFRAPCFHRIHTGVAETGTGVETSELDVGHGRWDIAPHHFVTPETESTTHYFQVVGHQWEESSDSWRFLNNVIDEDVWAIQKQQANIDLAPEAPTFPILSDGPMIALRRVIDRLIAQEEQGAGS
jgi:phenylpropionate dioxygenase-like ring-hydroxylating dioxygenase large terminal subunit